MNLKDYQSAASHFLTGLKLNPGAQHVWNYLSTAFISMKRYDLVTLIEQKNVLLFSKEFDIELDAYVVENNLNSSGVDEGMEWLQRDKTELI